MIEELGIGQYIFALVDVEDGRRLDDVDCGDDQIAEDVEGGTVDFEIFTGQTTECVFSLAAARRRRGRWPGR